MSEQVMNEEMNQDLQNEQVALDEQDDMLNRDKDGNVIGKVCSGTQSPSCGVAIGTAHVQTAFSKKDTEIFIKVREKLLKAVVVKMPFYKG